MSKKAWVKLIVIAAAAILFVILTWQNAGKISEIQFLFFPQIEIPLILLMIIIFALGFVAGIFTAFKISADRKKK